MAVLPAIAAGVSLLGTAVSAVGTIAAGTAQKSAANYQAQQREQQAMESRAAAQRTSMEHQRQTELMQSKLQANAAASGAGAADPTVVKLGEDIASRGEYQSLMDMYQGENRARGLQDQATADRLSGKAAQTGSYFSAAGTIASGAGSFLSKYANDFKTSPSYG